MHSLTEIQLKCNKQFIVNSMEVNFPLMVDS